MKRVILILIFLLNLDLVKGEEEMLPLLFSSLIPGGGQVYNGEYLKASLYSGFEIYFISSAYRYNLQKQKLFTYNKRDMYRRVRNTNIWLAVGTALLAIGDAIVDYKFNNFERDIAKKDSKITLKSISNGIMLVYEF